MRKGEKKSSKYAFLIEATSVTPNHEITILEEQKVEGRSKISAMVRLQEADQKNQNGRIYPLPICESIVSQLSNKARSRSLLMEIDHPLFTSTDQDILKKRAAVIEINNCGALLRDIYIKDKQIYGIFETLSSFKGPDLYNLIVKDKVDVGFSLRALGAVEMLSDGTIEVRQPIRAITYDIVSNPSHTNARVLEFLPENAQEFISTNSSSTVLYEGTDITVFDSNQAIKNFVYDIINERFLEIISKNIKFNL